MNYEDKLSRLATRRQLFRDCGVGLGGIALTSLFNGDSTLAGDVGGNAGVLHHPAKAKNVIVLFMAGGPSQLELFSHRGRNTMILA